LHENQGRERTEGKEEKKENGDIGAVLFLH
jgi:hypothetical protein